MKLKTIVILAILLLCTGSSRAQRPTPQETAGMLGKGFAELSGWIVKVAEMVPARLASSPATSPTAATITARVPPARKSSGPTRTRHDKTELGASRFQLDSLPGVALDPDERQLLAQFHDVDSNPAD